eukprot:scaffold255608_cov33-Tisochrysis_lutea.AAC.1
MRGESGGGDGPVDGESGTENVSSSNEALSGGRHTGVLGGMDSESSSASPARAGTSPVASIAIVFGRAVRGTNGERASPLKPLDASGLIIGRKRSSERGDERVDCALNGCRHRRVFEPRSKPRSEAIERALQLPFHLLLHKGCHSHEPRAHEAARRGESSGAAERELSAERAQAPRSAPPLEQREREQEEPEEKWAREASERGRSVEGHR